MTGSLLPPNAGAFEHALSATAAARFDGLWPLPALLSTLWDPWLCPESELKFLAWALSLDYWNDAWPVPTKRRVIAEARLYHRRKTTPAGVRMGLGYRAAELVAYHLPRHGFFVDPGVLPQDQTDWQAGLPEIRIYDAAPFVLAGPPRRYVSLNCIARGDARLARTAVLIKAGVETPLTIAPSGDDEVIRAPIAKKTVIIVGRAGSRAVGFNDIGATVLAVRPINSGAGDYVRPAATPGDQGAFVAAQRHMLPDSAAVFTPVAPLHPGRSLAFPVRPSAVHGLLVVAPTARVRGYLSLRYSDSPGRIAARRPYNVLGRSRVPRAAYTAAWTVYWHAETPLSHMPAGRKVFPSTEPLVAGFRDAIVSASAARDRNVFSLNATQRLTFADLRSVRAGTTFGQRKRILPYV
jgi:hypothetical protein